MRSLPALQSVISPVTIEDFFESYWEKRCLYVQRETSDYFDSVLSARDLDNYFQSKTLHPSFIRAIKSGVDRDAAEWTRVDKRLNTDLYTVVDTEKLFSQFSAGASLVVNVSEGSIPSLGRFCNAFEQELKIRLQANIYVTPPKEKGFVLHYDAHHIFILQTGGRKRWRLFGRAPDSVLTGQQSIPDYYQNREPEQELELRAGDLLYLPSYTVHEVYTTDSHSIHVSVGVYERRWYHLLQDLAKLAETSFDFQQPLPNWFSTDDDKRKFSPEFAQKLQALLARNTAEEIATNERSVFARDQLINADGWLLDLLRLNELKLESIVSKRPGIDCILKENGPNIEVIFWNKKIGVSRVLKPALDLLFADKPFAVSEIKGLISDTGKLEFVSEFVKGGLLTIRSI